MSFLDVPEIVVVSFKHIEIEFASQKLSDENLASISMYPHQCQKLTEEDPIKRFGTRNGRNQGSTNCHFSKSGSTADNDRFSSY